MSAMNRVDPFSFANVLLADGAIEAVLSFCRTELNQSRSSERARPCEGFIEFKFPPIDGDHIREGRQRYATRSQLVRSNKYEGDGDPDYHASFVTSSLHVYHRARADVLFQSVRFKLGVGRYLILPSNFCFVELGLVRCCEDAEYGKDGDGLLSCGDCADQGVVRCRGFMKAIEYHTSLYPGSIRCKYALRWRRWVVRMSFGHGCSVREEEGVFHDGAVPNSWWDKMERVSTVI
jgi:hypothetical protein